MDHTGNKSSNFCVLSCEHDVLQIYKIKSLNQLAQQSDLLVAYLRRVPIEVKSAIHWIDASW